MWEALRQDFPNLDEETLRWHLHRGDVLVGGHYVMTASHIKCYTNGRSCEDPNHVLCAGEEYCFCPIEILGDSH